MRTRTAREIDLLAKDKMREITMFQQKSFLDRMYVVNFPIRPVNSKSL